MEKLQQAIKYRFKDESILENALTHSSYTKENCLPRSLCNERLEFLGDAVLETIICEKLYSTMDEAREGKLTKIKSDIVRSESLAYIAREIGLGQYLKLGNGEIVAKGYDKTSILEDAMEALIGAIFLECGFDKTKEIVLEMFKEQIEKAIDGKLHLDYKSEFQEAVQSRGVHKIEYLVTKEMGKSHDKTFYVELILDGEVVGEGIGKSKKSAENKAAEAAMKNIDKILREI